MPTLYYQQIFDCTNWSINTHLISESHKSLILAIVTNTLANAFCMSVAALQLYNPRAL